MAPYSGLGPRCARPDLSRLPARTFRRSLPAGLARTRNTLPHRHGEVDPQLADFLLLAAARRGRGADPDPGLEDDLLRGHLGAADQPPRSPLDTLLQPHNEHLVLIPVLIEQLSLRLFGMTSALPEYVAADRLPAGHGGAALRLRRSAGSGPGPPSSRPSCCSSSAPPGRCCSGPSRSPSSARSSSVWRCCSRSNAKTAAATSPPVSAGRLAGLLQPRHAIRRSRAAVAILQGRSGTWRGAPTSSPSPSCSSSSGTWAGVTRPTRSGPLHNVLASPRFVPNRSRSSAGGAVRSRHQPVSHGFGVAWGWAMLVVAGGCCSAIACGSSAAFRPVSGRWRRWRRPTGS